MPELNINPTIAGTAAGVFTSAAMLPQLIKLLKEKKADDISLPMLFILFTGLCLWIWYGILKDDVVIIATNAFSLVVNVLMISFSIKYKKS